MADMHAVRRHGDGSIDMGFYRARAGTLRRAQIAQFGRASRRHVVQLFTQFADLIRPDPHRHAVLQSAVAGCRARRNGK